MVRTKMRVLTPSLLGHFGHHEQNLPIQQL
jgi:hypothetical protein